MSKEINVLKKRLDREFARKTEIIEQRRRLEQEEKKIDERVELFRSIIAEINESLGLPFPDSDKQTVPVGLKKSARVWILEVLNDANTLLTTKQIAEEMLKRGWGTTSKKPTRVIFPDIWKMKSDGWIESFESIGGGAGGNKITGEGKKALANIAKSQ